MMLTAEEARALMPCNDHLTKINKEIKKEAKNGGTFIYYNLPRRHPKIEEILHNLGYKVKVTVRHDNDVGATDDVYEISWCD